MTNYDFDKIIKYNNNNPSRILANYRYDSGQSIFTEIQNANGGDTDGLINTINKIVLWKINRSVSIDDQTLLNLLAVRTFGSATEALKNHQEEIRKLLTSLLKSKGVRLAVASTFLHFFNKSAFPIFDQRSYRVIYLKDYKASTILKANVDLYLEYLEKCISYYNTIIKNAFPFSEIDKYLYQLDIEAGNTVKM